MNMNYVQQLDYNKMFKRESKHEQLDYNKEN